MQEIITPRADLGREGDALEWARREIQQAAHTLEPELADILDTLVRDMTLWSLSWRFDGKAGWANIPVIQIHNGRRTKAGRVATAYLMCRKDGTACGERLAQALRLATEHARDAAQKKSVRAANMDLLRRASPLAQSDRFAGLGGNVIRPSVEIRGAAVVRYCHAGVELTETVRVDKLDDFVDALDAAAARIAEARVTYRP